MTPLTEVGLLPIGSRPAKRGLGAKSLDDLRTIPWIFSWAQARINLAAWYGLGTACEQFGDLNTLRQAYEEWPLFSTFIDNIEMSLAKTDERIAKMQEADAMVAADCPVIPVMFYTHTIVGSDRVKYLYVDPQKHADLGTAELA